MNKYKIFPLGTLGFLKERLYIVMPEGLYYINDAEANILCQISDGSKRIIKFQNMRPSIYRIKKERSLNYDE